LIKVVDEVELPINLIVENGGGVGKWQR